MFLYEKLNSPDLTLHNLRIKGILKNLESMKCPWHFARFPPHHIPYGQPKMNFTTVNSKTLVHCLGNALNYSSAMKSFSPFYSDIGLGIGSESGIDCLFFHYNRATTKFLTPFLSLPKAITPHQSTATDVTQFFEKGTAHIVFCDHNTWIVECEGVDQLEFGITHTTECKETRLSKVDETIHLFEALLPSLDNRDPDQYFPIILGLRVITGSATDGEGLTVPLQIQANPSGHIVLAFSARALDVEHESIVKRLQSASPTSEDALLRSQTWLEQAMGSFQAKANTAHESSVLARSVYTLISNSTIAPGFLADHISAFPSRGGYPTHFLWDSCFQNLATELMDPRLARDSLLLLTKNMRADGKMPHFLCSTWMRPHESQPPLVGWAGLRQVKARNDLNLAKRLLPALQRNTRWWLSQRMTRFSLISAPNGLETGWDDSPLFDQGPTVACDMNTYLVMQMRACAEFSSMLGDEAGATAQTAEANRYAQRMVDVLFNKDDCLFWNINVANGEPFKIKTPACFLPFLADVPLPGAVIKKSIETVLLNPACFFGKIPFPTIAYEEACYQPGSWWRGPTWMPVAYLMLLVLDKTGFHTEAASARAALYKMLIDDGNIRELFNSQTGEGMGAYEQGWTAAICLRLHQEIQEKA